MAGASKERRASRSPSRSAMTKKMRQASASVSVNSQRDSSAPLANRAKSVFRGHHDPYFPLKNKGNTSLPTGDDYVFRIQVISSTTDVTTDVFKKAVQGLVKICFPQDVLEEIGIEVVTQHMQNEDAPEENVLKMTEIFRSEMIHCVTWMLAEYLDTPAKVEASVKAIMAASASLHGEKIVEDVLGNVTASLDKLRERLPHDSTEGLANSTDMNTLAFSTPDLDTIQDESGAFTSLDRPQDDEPTANDSEESSAGEIEQPQTWKKKKQRRKDKAVKTAESRRQHKNAPEYAAPEDVTVKTTIQHTREGKEGKISTSWRWDVEEGASWDVISDGFKRTSDLFAYHALPIAKRQLGIQAKRKELRLEIEAMLAKMPNEEFEKWVESFQKLEAGDKSMLERIPVGPSSAGQRTVSATPAPVVARNFNKPAMERDPRHDVQKATNGSIDTTQAPIQPVVKREAGADRSGSGMTLQQDIHAKDRENHLPAKEATTTRDVGLHKATLSSRTPIVDLLWNTTNFELEARESVVQLIMSRLDSRVSATSITVQQLDGTKTSITKAVLKTRLLGRVTNFASRDDPQKIREGMEERLMPWVLAHPTAFQELLKEPFLFVSMMPSSNPTLDLLCDQSMPMSKADGLVVKTQLFAALDRRGISRFVPSGPKNISLSSQIGNVLSESETRHPDIVKRGFLEKIFRYLAFMHREKFPELKTTSLVKLWEQETGQVW